MDVTLTNEHCGRIGTTWYTEDEGGLTQTVGSTQSFVRGLDVASVDLETAVFGSRRGGIYLRMERDRDRYISIQGIIPRPPGRGARVCVAAGSLRFRGDSGETYGRNICGTVKGYRTKKDSDDNGDENVSDRWMDIRLDGDTCYRLGGSSGSPVYRREGRNIYGVSIVEGADTRGCPEGSRTAKIATASLMVDVLSRTSTYSPFITGPR